MGNQAKLQLLVFVGASNCAGSGGRRYNCDYCFVRHQTSHIFFIFSLLKSPYPFHPYAFLIFSNTLLEEKATSPTFARACASSRPPSSSVTHQYFLTGRNHRYTAIDTALYAWPYVAGKGLAGLCTTHDYLCHIVGGAEDTEHGTRSTCIRPPSHPRDDG